jgi:hypothetical protein
MKKIIFVITVILFTSNTIKAQCSCTIAASDTRWDKSFMKIGSNPASKYACGYQFSMKTTDTIYFRGGGYSCAGTSCTVKYKANITLSSTGAAVSTIDPFNFSLQKITLSRPGVYKMEIIPMCNNVSCKPCYYFFTVR